MQNAPTKERHKRPRPDSITGRLWAVYDTLLVDNNGVIPKRAQALEKAKINVPQAASGTLKTQFHRWRNYCQNSKSIKSDPFIAEIDIVEGMGLLEDFDPHVDEERPREPGIYVLYDISNRPIYVGEGQNVRDRINKHEQKFWFKKPIVESASWIKIPHEKLRSRLETLLIKFLKDNAVINRQNVDRG